MGDQVRGGTRTLDAANVVTARGTSRPRPGSPTQLRTGYDPRPARADGATPPAAPRRRQSRGGGANHGRVHLCGRRHSRQRDRDAVRSHYDAGNAFYALWLDERMVYSCGYFEDATMSLDDAQLARLDLICRKLRLRPGQRLLDIGCRWGALVIHAARAYGVDATGITLSEPQAAIARERIVAAGQADRCRVEVRDYRDLPVGSSFDRIASVGMVEQVGRAMLPTYFAEASGLLAPGGLFLNHGIVTRSPATGPIGQLAGRVWKRRSFIDRYVFPDGEMLPICEVVAQAEAAGLETRDVESLREHYALTLRLGAPAGSAAR